MLAGIKFIPRDQVDPSSVQEISESDSSPRRKKESRSKKKRSDKRRKKSRRDSSDVDADSYEIERPKGRTRRIGRNKKQASYSSDDDDDGIPSQSTSESHSDDDDEELRRKKRSQKRRGSCSSGKDAFSSEEDGNRHHGRRRKHVKDKQREIKKDGGDLSLRDKELSRKEMGLEWMFKPRDTVERRPAEPDDNLEEPALTEVKRPNPRELNPYLKDDGSGFPDDASHTVNSSSARLPSSVVGDGGASWRLKALKRAQEQAAREGRKLDEVVEERWGSLGQLAASVASHRVAHTHAHLRAIKDRRRGTTEKSETTAQDQVKGETAKADTGHRDYLQGVYSRHPEMRKPKQDSYAWKRKMDKRSSGNDPIISDALSKLNKFSNDGSFMDEMIHKQSEYAGSSSSTNVDMEVSECRVAEAVPSKTIEVGKEHSVGIQGLSKNQLAAKALQLRLKGKHEEAEELLKKVEYITDDQGSEAKVINQETGGNTSRYVGRRMPNQLKKMEDNADLNLAQKIIHNRQYSIASQADDEYDFDEAPTRKRSKKREVVAEKKPNLAKGILTQQERCQFCFENPTRPKHLVISIANFTYMMLPQWQPVVQGHCCVLTLQHEVSTRTVDDNVWEEIRNFKKCLLMMFAKQEKDVVFLETVMGLSKQRHHCLVDCIPLPRELAKEAPLYFKKAIDEAEDEWSQHNAKRLIATTSQKGLRRSIPKDFPYFHVEFGLDKGFVHVIDDEGKFKSSLGLDVIRGMLRLPEEDMYRRRRYEPLEKQRLAVATFAREWEPFDWTKQLK